MTIQQFCYCCRIHHAKDQMRLFPTRQGLRWRCIASIEGAHRNQDARDAFGRQQTEINREFSRRQAEHSQQLRSLGAPQLAFP